MPLSKVVFEIWRVAGHEHSLLGMTLERGTHWQREMKARRKWLREDESPGTQRRPRLVSFVKEEMKVGCMWTWRKKPSVTASAFYRKCGAVLSCREGL